jgi:hypothetical protein
MSNTYFRRLALSGHQLPPLCGPDNLTRGLAEAKPIRQTRPSLNSPSPIVATPREWLESR